MMLNPVKEPEAVEVPSLHKANQHLTGASAGTVNSRQSTHYGG